MLKIHKMDKSTKIIIDAGVGMINLTSKVWKKKFDQLIKDKKIEKDFGNTFLENLEVKIKKKQKEYRTFIKIISKPISKSKKKNKAKKKNVVSKKAIVEFTLETFNKTNKLWAKGFKQLIQEGKISEDEGKSFIKNINKKGQNQYKYYLKNINPAIPNSSKKGKNTSQKTFDSIIGMINLAKDSWKKKEAAKSEEKKVSNKQDNGIESSTENTTALEIHEKRIQDLESKVSLLLNELNFIKKVQQENIPIKKTIKKEIPMEKATKKEILTTKANSEKDDFKKIEGIGPKIESLLHSAGIQSFAQLSSTKTEAIKAILTEAGNRFKRHNPTTWAQQATIAAKGNWEALKKWQDELKEEK